MKTILTILMLVIAMGLVGCLHNDGHDSDRGRYQQDGGRYQQDGGRHDQDRDHNYAHHDRWW